jgi:urea transport system substrate-binding protein
MPDLSRRQFLTGTAASAAAALAGGSLLASCAEDEKSTSSGTTTAASGTNASAPSGQPWKLGALIPITGIETHVGQSMKVSTQIAVDEINAKGGILGRPIQLIVEDEAGDPATGVDKARKLMEQDKVDVIVGTLTSAVRNAVVDVTSKQNVLLFNPTYYEGGLCQKYFASTGALPNQQIEPFIPWVYQNLGKSIYLIGSDYVWPRGSNAFIKAYWARQGGKVVGEEYVPFGVTDFSASINRILDAKPDVLYPLVAGVDGITFWKQLAGFDFKGKRASHSVSEAIVPGLAADVAKGIISAGPYFMVVDNPANKAFLAEYHKRLDEKEYVDTFGEALYDAVHLIATGAAKANSLDVDKLIDGIKGAAFDAPQGSMTIDPATQQASLGFHIAEITGNTWKDFKIVESKSSIAPASDCGKAPPKP